MITADHGCDPDPRWETTDHSREYVPILAYSPSFFRGPSPYATKTAALAPTTVIDPAALESETAEVSGALSDSGPVLTAAALGTRGGCGVNLGIRSTLSDMGQTIAENFGAAIPHGSSFLAELVGAH